MPNYRRSSRRVVETVYCTISHLSKAALTETVLHTATDAETLVRSIVQLSCVKLTDGVKNLGLMLENQPNGVEVQGLSITETLDNERAKAMMWQHMMTGNPGVAHPVQATEVFADMRGMRKLQKGDTIVLKDKTVVDDDWHVTGAITLFFKAS